MTVWKERKERVRYERRSRERRGRAGNTTLYTGRAWGPGVQGRGIVCGGASSQHYSHQTFKNSVVGPQRHAFHSLTLRSGKTYRRPYTTLACTGVARAGVL
ncbi:hypothetical protein E2C01_077718 [Portunus trituberculatus]|uniref:Uncharacterized protein n=1 Tax=Portunus trituberculatus TaxID=210409 RepID=A0A5B7IM19_PORTR|nr:hypothetical protein [Portunus trituberculatus]